MRPKFRFPRGYHWIKKSDTNYEIISGNLVMDSYSLGKFYQDSLREDTLVCLGKVKGKPVAVIELTFHSGQTEGTGSDIEFYENSLVVELLAVNGAYLGQGVGTKIMVLAENIATSLSAHKISLEVIHDKVDFYKRVAYTIESGKYIDSEWGALVPMERVLINGKFYEERNTQII